MSQRGAQDNDEEEIVEGGEEEIAEGDEEEADGGDDVEDGLDGGEEEADESLPEAESDAEVHGRHSDPPGAGRVRGGVRGPDEDGRGQEDREGSEHAVRSL